MLTFCFDNSNAYVCVRFYNKYGLSPKRYTYKTNLILDEGDIVKVKVASKFHAAKAVAFFDGHEDKWCTEDELDEPTPDEMSKATKWVDSLATMQVKGDTPNFNRDL